MSTELLQFMGIIIGLQVLNILLMIGIGLHFKHSLRQSDVEENPWIRKKV